MRAGVKSISQKATLLFLVMLGSFSTTQVCYAQEWRKAAEAMAKKAGLTRLAANPLNDKIAGKFVRIKSKRNGQYFRAEGDRFVAKGSQSDASTILKVIGTKSKTGLPVLGFQSPYAGCKFLQSTPTKTKEHEKYEVKLAGTGLSSWEQWLLFGASLGDCQLKALLGSKAIFKNPGKRYKSGKQTLSAETAWTKGPAGDSRKLSIEIVDVVPAEYSILPDRGMVTIAAGSPDRVLGVDKDYLIPWYWNEGAKKWAKFPGLPENYKVDQISVGKSRDYVWCIGYKTKTETIRRGLFTTKRIVKHGHKAFRWNVEDRTWEEKGNFTHVSVGSADNVWALSTAKKLRYWNGTNWKTPQQPSGKPIDVSVGGDNAVWCKTTAGIYRFLGGNRWEKLPSVSGLRKLSVGNAFNVWALDAGDKVFKWNEKGRAWDVKPGMMKQISVNKQGDVVGGLWGITYCHTVIKPGPNPAPKPETEQNLENLMRKIETDIKGVDEDISNYQLNRWLHSLYLLVENMEGKSFKKIQELVSRIKTIDNEYIKAPGFLDSFNDFQKSYVQKYIKKGMRVVSYKKLVNEVNTTLIDRSMLDAPPKSIDMWLDKFEYLITKKQAQINQAITMKKLAPGQNARLAQLRKTQAKQNLAKLKDIVDKIQGTTTEKGWITFDFWTGRFSETQLARLKALLAREKTIVVPTKVIVPVAPPRRPGITPRPGAPRLPAERPGVPAPPPVARPGIPTPPRLISAMAIKRGVFKIIEAFNTKIDDLQDRTTMRTVRRTPGKTRNKWMQDINWLAKVAEKLPFVPEKKKPRDTRMLQRIFPGFNMQFLSKKAIQKEVDNIAKNRNHTIKLNTAVTGALTKYQEFLKQIEILVITDKIRKEEDIKKRLADKWQDYYKELVEETRKAFNAIMASEEPENVWANKMEMFIAKVKFLADNQEIKLEYTNVEGRKVGETKQRSYKTQTKLWKLKEEIEFEFGTGSIPAGAQTKLQRILARVKEPIPTFKERFKTAEKAKGYTGDEGKIKLFEKAIEGITKEVTFEDREKLIKDYLEKFVKKAIDDKDVMNDVTILRSIGDLLGKARDIFIKDLEKTEEQKSITDKIDALETSVKAQFDIVKARAAFDKAAAAVADRETLYQDAIEKITPKIYTEERISLVDKYLKPLYTKTMADDNKNKDVSELGGLKTFFTKAKEKFTADLSTTDKTRVGDMIESIIKGLDERIKELAPKEVITEKRPTVVTPPTKEKEARVVKKPTPRRRRTR